MRRLSRHLTVLRVLVLLALFGATASPVLAAPPIKPTATRRTISEERRAQLKASAKLRDRNEKGQFLPNVSAEAISARAYQKFEARNRATGHVVHGHDQEDYAVAKRELQDEKMAQNRLRKAFKVELELK